MPNPTPEQYRDIAHTLAEALRHNMQLLAAIGSTAEAAARDINGVLTQLDQAVAEPAEQHD